MIYFHDERPTLLKGHISSTKGWPHKRGFTVPELVVDVAAVDAVVAMVAGDVTVVTVLAVVDAAVAVVCVGVLGVVATVEVTIGVVTVDVAMVTVAVIVEEDKPFIFIAPVSIEIFQTNETTANIIYH